MYAAQHPEHHTEDESHGHSQQRGQQAVKDELDQLKGGVASYPHSVEAVRGRGLRDDIFEVNLSGQPSHAKTEKVIISADTHGGLWARTQAVTSRYSGSKCYTQKKGQVTWCTEIIHGQAISCCFRFETALPQSLPLAAR